MAHTSLNSETSYSSQVATFLSLYGSQLHEARRQSDLATWNFQQHSSEENRDALLVAENAMRKTAGDTAAYAIVCALLQDEHYKNLDRQSQRALQTASEFYEQNVTRPTDDPQFQSLREDLDARAHELARITTVAVNPSDLGAQVPDGQNKPFAELLRDLVVDRNRLARMRGFDDYYQMRMAEANMDFEQMRRMLKALKIALDALQPRISFIAAQGPSSASLKQLCERVTDAPALLSGTARLMGVPKAKVDALLATSDFYPRDLKYKSWFVSQIDPPFDVRIHMNIHRSPDKLTGKDVKNQLLHEVFGHGVDCLSIDPALQPLLRQLDSFTAEAVAKLAEELVFEPRWLRSVLGLAENELQTLQPHLWRLQLDQTVANLRRNIAFSEFEVSMYDDPTQDLDTAYARFWAWALNKPAGQYEVSPGSWAVDVPHYVTFPAYCHNYVLGLACASQFKQTMRQRFGAYASRRTGPFLAKFRSSGLLYTSDEKIVQITGRKLDVSDLVAELNRLVVLLEDEVIRAAAEAQTA